MKTLLLLLLVSSVAKAANFEFQTPKQQWAKLDLPTLAISALPVMYTQLVLHETSHALLGLALGASSVSIKPYPNTDGGQFTFAYATIAFPDGYNYGNAALVVSASAQILDALVVIGICIVDNLVELPPWLHTILKVWQVACVIDFTTNMLGLWRPGTSLDPQNDFRDVYYGLAGMTPAAARLVTGLVDGALGATVLCF